MATGQHGMDLVEGFPTGERKVLNTSKRTTYSLIDYYGTSYELYHYDLEVAILGHLTLKQHDSTFINASGAKVLILCEIGSAALRLKRLPCGGVTHARFIDADFPPEGIRVRITDTDAFVWRFSDSKLGIDNSPETLGISI